MEKLDLGNGYVVWEHGGSIEITRGIREDGSEHVFLTAEQAEALFAWLQRWRSEQWRKGKRG